jgi:lipoprotein signal peptidase
MSERSYRGLLWSLALLGAVLDQASKYTVFRWLHDDQPILFSGRVHQGERVIIPGAFKLLTQFTGETEEGTGLLATLRTLNGNAQPKVNHGALFGLGGEYANYANGVFAAVSILAAVAISYWSTRRSTAKDWSLCAALGLIMAGTLGNLYDRVVFHGVRDFLYFHLIEWPVFNLADCCLVCGAFLLLAQAFLGHHNLAGKLVAGVSRAPEMAEAK